MVECPENLKNTFNVQKGTWELSMKLCGTIQTQGFESQWANAQLYCLWERPQVQSEAQATVPSDITLDGLTF